MVEYDLNNLTDAQIDNMSAEEQAALTQQLDNQDGDSSTSPTPEKKDSTLILFREIIDKDDTTKLGFLQKDELGRLPHSVRSLKRISLFAETQNLHEIAEYINSQAEIVLATSLSFKGKLIDNIVTQIKKDMKVSSQPPITKQGWFGKKTTTETEGEIPQ